MRSFILTLLLAGAASIADAQIDIGVQGGLGSTILKTTDIRSNAVFEARVSKPLTERYTIGLGLAYNKYAFEYDNKGTTTSLYTSGININHKSSYLFLSPMADVGVGKKKIQHFILMPQAGFLLSGTENTYEFLRFSPYPNDTSSLSYNSKDRIRKIVFRLGFEMQQRIPIAHNMRLTFSEGICLPLTDISNDNGRDRYGDYMDGKRLNPSYAYLQVGLQYRIEKKKKAVAPEAVTE